MQSFQSSRRPADGIRDNDHITCGRTHTNSDIRLESGERLTRSYDRSQKLGSSGEHQPNLQGIFREYSGIQPFQSSRKPTDGIRNNDKNTCGRSHAKSNSRSESRERFTRSMTEVIWINPSRNLQGIFEHPNTTNEQNNGAHASPTKRLKKTHQCWILNEYGDIITISKLLSYIETGRSYEPNIRTIKHNNAGTHNLMRTVGTNVTLVGSNHTICVERKQSKWWSAQALHLTMQEPEIGWNTENTEDKV